MGATRDDREWPGLQELRACLIPAAQDRWDEGELPRAVLNLENQIALRQCHSLLSLACVVRRSLDGTRESRAVALREVLLELLPKELDHPSCEVLRILAGLQPGTSGRRREQRQWIAGRRLGSERQPASPRTARRFVKQRCWPWLLDRLIEREIQERKAMEVEAVGSSRAARASSFSPISELAPSPGPPEAMGERLWATMAGACRADAQLVGHLEVLLAHYRALDDLMGPRHVLPPVRFFVRLIDRLHESAGSHQQALLSLAAQYEQLAGWLWVDSGNHAMAQYSFDRALARATESGNHALIRYLLTCKSEQALVASQAPRAIMLAQEAQRVLGDPNGTWRLTPAVQAWAADLEGRSWALLGEDGKCKGKLDESADLLAESAQNQRAEEPPWIYHFVERALEVHRGICLTSLGKAEEGIAAFEQAIAMVPGERVRERAYYLYWFAKAHARNNDSDQACTVAKEAARLALSTGSTRVLDELRRLCGGLDGKSAAVRELGELLQHPITA